MVMHCRGERRCGGRRLIVGSLFRSNGDREYAAIGDGERCAVQCDRRSVFRHRIGRRSGGLRNGEERGHVKGLFHRAHVMRLNGDGQLLAGHLAGDLRLAASLDRAGFGSVERSRDHQLTVHRQGSACRNDQFLSRVHRQGRTVGDLSIGGQFIIVADDRALAAAEEHTGAHIIAALCRLADDPAVPVIIGTQCSETIISSKTFCNNSATIDCGIIDTSTATGIDRTVGHGKTFDATNPIGICFPSCSCRHGPPRNVQRAIFTIIISANSITRTSRIHNSISRN